MKLLDSQAPVEGTEFAPEAEALFREARKRERRRRFGVALAVLLVAGGAGAAVAIIGGGAGRTVQTTVSSPLGKGGPTVDGKAFAHEGLLTFASNGALYVLDGATGTLREVGDLRSGAEEPSFSHDDRWLAYIAAGTVSSASGFGPQAPYAPWSGPLVVSSADGSPARRVTAVGSVEEATWSPNADLLLVVTANAGVYAGTAVWVVSPSGAARKIFSGGNIYGAVWSPDGTQVAVAFAGSIPIREVTLETMSATGGRPTVWVHTYASNLQWLVPLGWWKDQGIGAWIGGNGAVASGEGTLSGAELVLISAPGARILDLGKTPAIGLTPAVGSSTGWLALDDLAGNSWGRTPWSKGSIETCTPTIDRCRVVPEAKDMTSIDPVWSPDGRTLAFVEAPASTTGSFFNSFVRSWYGSGRLYLLKERTTRPVPVPHSLGATAPQFSPGNDGFVYVANDALYLVRTPRSTSVRIAGPLFPTKEWTSTYYGMIDWRFMFAWAK